MSLSPIPTTNIATEPKTGELVPVYQAWFASIQRWLAPIGQSGNARPTTNLYVGQMFFHTGLGYPIWVKQVSPALWVDAGGVTR